MRYNRGRAIFNADKTGQSDVTAEFERQMEQAASAGHYLWMPPGRYYFKAANPDSSLLIKGEPGTVEIIHDNDTNAIAWNNADQSTVFANVSALSVEVSQSHNWGSVLAVDDVSDFEENRYVHIHSQDDQTYGGQRYAGEGAQILYIDTANNKLHLDRILKYHNLYATSPIVRMMDESRKFEMEGISFTHRNQNGGEDEKSGGWLDPSITTREESVVISACVRPRIENCRAYKLWAAFLRAEGTMAGKMKNVDSWELTNMRVDSDGDGDVDSNDSVRGLGYVLQPYAVFVDWLIDGCTTWQSRHFITPDGRDGSSYNANLWYLCGQSTVFDVQNCNGFNIFGYFIDSHRENKGMNVSNCHVKNPNSGNQGGSITSGGFAQIRGADTTITNCSIDGGHRGIVLKAYEHGAGSFFKVDGFNFNDIINQYDDAYAVLIEDQDDLTNPQKVDINNIRGKDAGRTIRIGKNTPGIIQGAHLASCGEFMIDVLDGVELDIFNSVMDFRGKTGQISVKLNDTCTVRAKNIHLIYDDDAAIADDCLFYNGNSTGTKTVSYEGITQGKSGAASADLSALRAGHESAFTVVDMSVS